MRLLLILVALALLGCGNGALSRSHFKLPRFELLDKDGDGSITEAEIGRTVVEVGTILAKQANIDMGSIDMGNIDREEYERMEQTIRKTAHRFLQHTKISEIQTVLQGIIAKMQNVQDDIEGNLVTVQRYFESSAFFERGFESSPVFDTVRDGISMTLSRYPDNLDVRDRMETVTLLMKDPQVIMGLNDPYISEVVYALIRDSTAIDNFRDDPKLMPLLERVTSKYKRNRYVSDLLNRIASGQCTFCDE